MQLQEMAIDYSLLGKAAEFYRIAGFTEVQVPWVVEPYWSRVTNPHASMDNTFVLNDGNCLLASAEQGLIRNAVYGLLKPEKDYFSISPCFRRDRPSETHSQWFMKLELFRIAAAQDAYTRLARVARDFFIECGVEATLFATPEGCDLMYDGLELGSYGMRVTPDISIAYGTGLALPRFSLALP